MKIINSKEEAIIRRRDNAMVAKRKGTKRQNILARQLKTDQQEPHRLKKKKEFSAQGENL